MKRISPTYGQLLKDNAALVAELEQYRFIPVEEGMPEHLKTVDLYAPLFTSRTSCVGSYDGKHKQWTIYGTTHNYKVTHWRYQVLPKDGERNG